MPRIIGFSTGPVHTWNESIDAQVSILKRTAADAIEVLFAKPDELDQEMSKDNISYLKSLGFVTIHSPFYLKDEEDFYYESTEGTRDIFKKIKSVYELIGAKAVVFHQNLVLDHKLLENTGMNACIENMPQSRKVHVQDILESHPKLGLTLDTAHALTYGPDYLNTLIDRYKGRIQYVHFSDHRFSPLKGKMKSHQTFYDCPDKHKFEKVRELGCPIIIENSLNGQEGNNSLLEKELACVKDFFR